MSGADSRRVCPLSNGGTASGRCEPLALGMTRPRSRERGKLVLSCSPLHLGAYMSIRTSVLAVPGALVVAGIITLACSSPTGLTAKILSGSYVLNGYELFSHGGSQAWGSPQPGGSLSLTTTTYKAFAIVDTGANSNVPDTVVSDTGTYRVHGSLVIETSATGAVDTALASLSKNKDTLTLLFQGKSSFAWVRTQ